MTQPPSLPASFPAVPPPNQFSLRNWWRNGGTCRITVFVALLMLLNLFQPWDANFSGSGYTTTSVGSYYKTTTYHSGAKYVSSNTSFTKGQGWVPLVVLLGTLYVCGKPRASWGGWRWLPLWTAIIVFAVAFDEQRAVKKEMDEWTSKLSSKPFVSLPAAIQWEIIFSVPLAICGILLARKSKQNSPATPLLTQNP